MKKTLLIVLLLSFGFSQQEYNANDLVEKDNGLWTEKFSDEPITGKVYGYFGEVKPYKKVYVGNIVNGKKEGKWTFWYHETGTKEFEENFKDGKKEGLVIRWYKTGQKFSEINNKDDKTHGLWVVWYNNGKKKKEKTFKNGIRIGIETDWYENGQKKSENIFDENGALIGKGIDWYENGQKKRVVHLNDKGWFDGLWTEWYENGQKKRETLYDPETIGSKLFVSEKCWDINGNERKCK